MSPIFQFRQFKISYITKSLIFSIISNMQYLHPAIKNLSDTKIYFKALQFGKNNFNIRRVCLVFSGFAFTAHLVYHQFIDTKISVVFNKSAENEFLFTSISHHIQSSYKPTIYLPFRCMELISGNIFDSPDLSMYQREIIYVSDGENLALGSLIRLDLFHKNQHKLSNRCVNTWTNWWQFIKLHHVW